MRWVCSRATGGCRRAIYTDGGALDDGWTPGGQAGSSRGASLTGVDLLKEYNKPGPPTRRGVEELVAPVPRPGKVVAIGRNYRDDVRRRRRGQAARRRWCSPSRTSSVVGEGAKIRWDPALTAPGGLRGRARGRHRPDRTAGRAIDALDHVLGYTCLNDVVGPRPPVRGRPVGARQSRSTRSARWARGRDRRRDPQFTVLAISCSVGAARSLQIGNTADIFSWSPGIIRVISRASTSSPATSSRPGRPAGSASSATRRWSWRTVTSRGQDGTGRPPAKRLPHGACGGGKRMSQPAERFLVTGALGCIGAWTVRNLVSGARRSCSTSATICAGSSSS